MIVFSEMSQVSKNLTKCECAAYDISSTACSEHCNYFIDAPSAVNCSNCAYMARHNSIGNHHHIISLLIAKHSAARYLNTEFFMHVVSRQISYL